MYFRFTLEFIKTGVSTIWKAIIDYFVDTWNGLVSFVKAIWNGIKTVFTTFESIMVL